MHAGKRTPAEREQDEQSTRASQPCAAGEKQAVAITTWLLEM
jgi:hypothetical protein